MDVLELIDELFANNLLMFWRIIDVFLKAFLVLMKVIDPYLQREKSFLKQTLIFQTRFK